MALKAAGCLCHFFGAMAAHEPEGSQFGIDLLSSCYVNEPQR